MIKICGWCLNEFIWRPRPEARELRERLLICDEGFEPVICDDCLNGIGALIVKTSPMLTTA